MNKPIHFATKQLINYRLDRDWTQEEMAQFLTLQLGRKVSRFEIIRWENQTRGINAEVALNIASILKIPIMQLVEQH